MASGSTVRTINGRRTAIVTKAGSRRARMYSLGQKENSMFNRVFRDRQFRYNAGTNSYHAEYTALPF